MLIFKNIFGIHISLLLTPLFNISGIKTKLGSPFYIQWMCMQCTFHEIHIFCTTYQPFGQLPHAANRDEVAWNQTHVSQGLA